MLLRFSLIILCYLFLPFRSRARGAINPTAVQKVAVVQLAKMGDMVCTTHLFHHIKARYPSVTLFVVGDKMNKELLQYNNDVDEYIVFDETKLWSFYKWLKHSDIDVAILIQTNFFALALLYLSDIRHIICSTVTEGTSIFETRSYRMIRNLATVFPKRTGHYIPGEYLQFLHPLGIRESDTTKHLAYSKEAKTKVVDFLERRNIHPERNFIVGLSPSAGNKIKEWPREYFARVADYLIEKHKANVCLIGGPKDKELVEEVLKYSKHRDKCITTQGVFNLDELKAFVDQLHLFISADTGPIYIAEAFSVPTIDIVGPVDEREQPPQGEKHRTVVAPREKPALHIMNARSYDYKEARRQVEEITPEMVIKEIEVLITTHHLEVSLPSDLEGLGSETSK